MTVGPSRPGTDGAMEVHRVAHCLLPAACSRWLAAAYPAERG